MYDGVRFGDQIFESLGIRQSDYFHIHSCDIGGSGDPNFPDLCHKVAKKITKRKVIEFPG